MCEKFDKEVTFEYANLASGSNKTVVRTEEQFEELRQEAYRLGYDTLSVDAVEVPTKQLNLQQRAKGELSCLECLSTITKSGALIASHVGQASPTRRRISRGSLSCSTRTVRYRRKS